jgi:trans-2,3-dihydro-3-hydroxyanthranilate isomerase
MAEHRYRVVDVFSEHALEGNPLAVFPDAAGLDETTMQRIARELNLSETAFFLPATRADCLRRVRIFTPQAEMRFAGHPTVGSAFVLLDEAAVAADASEFALELKIGPIPIRVDRTRLDARPLIWLRTPPIAFGNRYRPEACAQALGLSPDELADAPPELVSAGNPLLYVALRDRAAVDRAAYDRASASKLLEPADRGSSMFVFTPTSEGAYSRMFAPEHGIAEDPATGSATGPLAAYMMRHGLAASSAGTHLISEQGTRMGRRSILHVLVHGEQGRDGIEVGGYVTPLVNATLTL